MLAVASRQDVRGKAVMKTATNNEKSSDDAVWETPIFDPDLDVNEVRMIELENYELGEAGERLESITSWNGEICTVGIDSRA